MKHEIQHSEAGFRQGEFSPLSDFFKTPARERILPQAGRAIWAAPNAGKTLAEAGDALVAAYLDASLNQKIVPLKEFMDDLEKNILLACLRLTHGNQRNAAALLGLKPTALFEKMRKHHINGRRIKLSEKLMGARHQEIA